MPHRSLLLRAAAAAVLVALAGCGAMMRSSGTERYEASLGGAQEVPPAASAGTGQAELQYHPATGTLGWRVSYGGLSGPVTGAHIHGPAGPGQNAGVVIPFANTPSPITGEARITPEQLGQLASGQWYVNLHTARHPGGEIRGQLRPRR